MNIDTVLTVLQVLAAIAALIFIHELGHFVVARLLGVEVEEFGIGFPPRLATLFHAGGTRFSMNWLPIGGFVRPKGENDPSIPGGLAAASPWVRIAVLAAGPVFNLITAIILFAVIFLRFGIPTFGPLLIQEVAPNSPADLAGLVPGDIIQTINGDPVTSQSNLQMIVNQPGDDELNFGIQRGEISEEIRITPPLVTSMEDRIGVLVNETFKMRPVSPFGAFYLGLLGTGSQMRSLATLPAKVIEGSIAPSEARLVGYKGMVDLYQNMKQTEIQAGIPTGVIFLFFTASISVSLGLINLLPIPALDGGRILLTLPEIIFRRRIPRFYKAILNTGSMAALILLMIYINLQDFINPAQIP